MECKSTTYIKLFTLLFCIGVLFDYYFKLGCGELILVVNLCHAPGVPTQPWNFLFSSFDKVTLLTVLNYLCK